MLTETQKTAALKYQYIPDILDQISSGQVIRLVPESTLTPDTVDAVKEFYATRNTELQEKLAAMSAEDLIEIIEDESREYGIFQATDSYYNNHAEIDREKARTEILRRLGAN